MKHVRFEMTPMMRRYLVKFLIRIFVFVFIFILYIKDKQQIYDLATHPLKFGISPIRVLWLVFMVVMLRHIFPTSKLSMALRKAEKQNFQPQERYLELDLLKYVQNQNVRAWKVMLIWLSFNAVFGLLYLLGMIDEADLLMLTVFYFLCDYICILLYCPFQSLIMKNTCCVNCRIYEWGHFMMFTPMLFIKDFFSWSLFFTSLVVLIRWEIAYAKHPERFWSGSNTTLQCINCKDKTCQIKKGLRGKRQSK